MKTSHSKTIQRESNYQLAELYGRYNQLGCATYV